MQGARLRPAGHSRRAIKQGRRRPIVRSDPAQAGLSSDRAGLQRDLQGAGGASARGCSELPGRSVPDARARFFCSKQLQQHQGRNPLQTLDQTRQLRVPLQA